LKEFEGLISLDVQGYVREIRDGRVTASVSPLLVKALQACCIIKATEQEFELILNAWEMNRAEFMHRYALDEILVTCGGSGGYLLAGKHARTEYPAVPSGRPGDTTGAGDVLFAAYLTARYYEGLGREDALLHAARIASLHVGSGYIPPEDLLIRSGQDPVKGAID
jgi:sugar/nucleoside kinase (ribokinase family)